MSSSISIACYGSYTMVCMGLFLCIGIWCGMCDRKRYHQEYYEKNKISILAQEKEYREKNREKLLEYSRKHYIANKKTISEYGKEYRKKNAESISEKRHLYYMNNKKKCMDQKKEYYEKNKQKILDRQKIYEEKNKQRFAERKREYQKWKYHNVLVVKRNVDLMKSIMDGDVDTWVKKKAPSLNHPWRSNIYTSRHVDNI